MNKERVVKTKSADQLPGTTMDIFWMDGDRGAPVVRLEPQPNALGPIKVTSKTGRLGWGRTGGQAKVTWMGTAERP